MVCQPWIQAAAAAFTVHCHDAVVWPSLVSVWPSLASCTVSAATGLLPFVTCHFLFAVGNAHVDVAVVVVIMLVEGSVRARYWYHGMIIRFAGFGTPDTVYFGWKSGTRDQAF